MKIVGLTHPYSTNNAACVMVDGQLIAFAEEERFIRFKHAPHLGAKQAMGYCLKTAGLKLEDIDYFAIGMDDWQKCIWPNLAGQSFGYTQSKLRNTIRNLRTLRWQLPIDWRDRRVMNVNHHRAHIASSFFVSGFKEANIISMDGAGESEAGLLAVGRGTKVEILGRISNEGSWGSLYEKVTGKLGFKKHSEEGKVMGLSSYGTPDTDRFNEFIDWSEPLPKINRKRLDDFLSKIKTRGKNEEITQEHKDLAATLQANLEKAGLKMAEFLYKKSGIRKLCLSGGIALNCAMNGKLLQSEYVDDIYIQPASSDAGTALGAAIQIYVEKTGKRPDFVFDHAYWGPEFDNEEIGQILKECKTSKYHKSENIYKEAARKMADGMIVGWFQGRMEAGPRALGCRSIICNPSDPGMKDRVNKNVKKREPWRPFAPSALEESAHELVEGYYPSPFMILAFQVKKNRLKDMVSAAHVDESVRLQTVSQKTNPKYWQVIDEFRKITGLPVVLNTSFNIAGEPIVCTPRDALRTFFGSGMDCLAIGDYLVEK